MNRRNMKINKVLPLINLFMKKATKIEIMLSKNSVKVPEVFAPKVPPIGSPDAEPIYKKRCKMVTGICINAITIRNFTIFLKKTSSKSRKAIA